MKTKKYKIALILLLVFSFFVRIYKINILSLFGDEIDVGIQAYSLLKTGCDYKGNFLPVYVQSLSESRAPLLIYTSVPGIWIFGLTATGVRITPIIFGVLSIFLIYKLVLLLSKSEKLAFWSAFALSFTPCHFHYSRTSFEVTLLISLILAGTYFAYKFLDNKKNKFLYLAIIFFCLGFYTYNTANIFIPLTVLTIFFTNLKIFKSIIKIKSFFVSLFLFLLLTLPLLYQIFFGAAANRFGLVSIFHDQNLINQIITKRTSFSAASPKMESIFHNKPVTWIGEFTRNYITSISPSFLFVNGDQLNLRHSIPGFGLIFIIFLPFLLTGLFKLDFKHKLNQLMFFWLIFSPIASCLTINGGTHVTRLFLMIIPLAYFSALGLIKVLNFKNIFATILIIISALLLVWEICAYSHEYFVHYPKDSFEVWNYGYKELFQSIPQTDQKIFISNAKYNSLLPYAFYQNYSGFLNDREEKNIFKNLSGFKLNQNIIFINNFNNTDHLNEISQIAQSGDIFLLFQGSDIPGDMDFSQKPLNGFKTIKTVYNPNHTILGQVIQKL